MTQTTQQPVKTIQRDGVKYTLLGTAHVSKASADAVEEYMDSGEYDRVAIELCDSRFDSMQNPDRLHELDLFKVFREGKGHLVAANLALSAYQRRIAEQFGIEPGAEMKAAIKKAEHHHIDISLVDRDVGLTMLRVSRAVRWWERINLMMGLFASMLVSEDISEDDIEKLKNGDVLESTFTEFAAQSDSLYHALIDERDQFMAAKLRQIPEQSHAKNILVVIGAGHLKGMATYLENEQRPADDIIQEMSTRPKPGKFGKMIPRIITALVISGFAWGFSRSEELGWNLIQQWVLINGSLSALGAMIAGAHPLTIITAFFAAPLTSLNPAIGAGMVTGSLEAWLRKPRVIDFKSMRDDVVNIKGWYRNRVTRTFLVFLLSTAGSAIGTWVAGLKIVAALSQ
ncbi:MAG: TraB/GumN family protein [bacterium]